MGTNQLVGQIWGGRARVCGAVGLGERRERFQSALGRVHGLSGGGCRKRVCSASRGEGDALLTTPDIELYFVKRRVRRPPGSSGARKGACVVIKPAHVSVQVHPCPPYPVHPLADDLGVLLWVGCGRAGVCRGVPVEQCIIAD